MNYDINLSSLFNSTLINASLENEAKRIQGQVMQQIGVPPVYANNPNKFRQQYLSQNVPNRDGTHLTDEDIDHSNKTYNMNNLDIKKLLTSKEMYIGLAVGFLLLPKILKKRY